MKAVTEPVVRNVSDVGSHQRRGGHGAERHLIHSQAGRAQFLALPAVYHVTKVKLLS